MQDDEQSRTTGVLSNETLLLWLAVGLAIVFLALLVFDIVRRRRRARRRQQSDRGTLREKLLKPVQRVRAFQSDLDRMFHERSRRGRRHRPRPPGTPP